jgi:hypothetical protein
MLLISWAISSQGEKHYEKNKLVNALTELEANV